MLLWLATWLQVDSQQALTYLDRHLRTCENPGQLMVGLCSAVSGEEMERGPRLESAGYLSPAGLRRFIPLVYEYVRVKDDIDRSGGAYSPTARDHAQRFRGFLLDRLARDEAAEATDVMRELADEPALAEVRDWVLNLIAQRLERRADLTAWTPNDLREFAANYETDPKNEGELFIIAKRRIEGLKNDVEQSDNSQRDELHRDQQEIHFRRWLARNLARESRGRYNVPQEPEIDFKQRPDIRFLKPLMGPVSLEAKLAENWTVAELLKGLETQLVGQYLRAHDSHYGLYVLGIIGEKQHWEQPETGARLSFEQVIELLQRRAAELVQQDPHIGDVTVIGIDFRQPTKT